MHYLTSTLKAFYCNLDPLLLRTGPIWCLQMIVWFLLSELTLVMSSGRTALGDSLIYRLRNCPKSVKSFAPALKFHLVQKSSLRLYCCPWVLHLFSFHRVVRNKVNTSTMNTITMWGSLILLSIFGNANSDGTHHNFVGSSQMFL